MSDRDPMGVFSGFTEAWKRHDIGTLKNLITFNSRLLVENVGEDVLTNALSGKLVKHEIIACSATDENTHTIVVFFDIQIARGIVKKDVLRQVVIQRENEDGLRTASGCWLVDLLSISMIPKVQIAWNAAEARERAAESKENGS